METKKHVYPLIILESHLDTFGHVNNATYLEVFEEARWDLITKNGYGLKKMLETQQGPVILEARLKFLKELKLRQQVNIETILESSNKKLITIAQQIVDDQNQVYCKAEFLSGLFDLKERKLVAPTPLWLKAIGINSL